MFVYTSAIKKLRKLTKRIREIPGGTSAGKTFGILPLLIDRAIKTPLLEISVVSESVPHLKRGAIKDFKKIMKATNRWIPEHWHGTDLKYTFSNDSYIEFFSVEQEDKVRGPRRNILYINECNNISFDTYHQLAIRTDMEVWLDYNPSSEFWVHTELNDDKDVEKLILTYKDNEALAETLVQEIEKARTKAFNNEFAQDLFADSNIKNKYWANWWRVYGMGLVGSLEGVIFKNWTTIDEVPANAKLVSYGMDFGYTNDPTTLIACYKYDNDLIFDELIYQTGLLNSEIIKLIKAHGISRDAYIYADSAEPKSIEEISRGGILIRGAIKGKDSINYGIDFLQGYNLKITKRSVNTIKELRGYTWDVDKTGKKLNKPIDAFNHCFVGETLITTNKGQKRIDKINIGDLVLTSQGFKKVNKVFKNGIKKTYKYSMQCDTFFVSLICTESHKIKTTKGWKCIKNLTESDILYIETKGILAVEQKECTLRYGSFTTKKFQRGFMFIIKTRIHTITQLIISSLLIESTTLQNTQKKDSWKIQNLLKIFKKKVLALLQSGIKAKKVLNGIGNMLKNLVLERGNYPKENAIFAKKSISQKQNIQNFAIQTARLYQIEEIGNCEQLVYDLEVDEVHEYFANGILVHNCIDSMRYAVSNMKNNKVKDLRGMFH